MKSRLVAPLAIAASALFPGCESTGPAQPEGKVGFIIESHSPHPDSIQIMVSTDEILEELPVITINGKKHITSWESATVWSFSSIPIGDPVKYRIEWSDDTLAGEIAIPRKIDSVFCNGRYLENFTGGGGSVGIEPASSYEFTWTTQGTNQYYHVNYYLQDSSWHWESNITTSRSVTILPGPLGNQSGISIDFSVFNRNGADLRDSKAPHNKSGKMFIYHAVRGPEYRAYIYASGSQFDFGQAAGNE